MKRVLNFLLLRPVCGLILLFAFGGWTALCQEAASSTAKQAAKAPEASGKQPELPAQIELLETRVRFEANGDSRKEVHTRVHINNELGARQFARLAFDYNRLFQQIEFPLVRITHEGGGTVDILPSAIADQPNPAVVNAPAYQDVRVKSVRILGLAPGDILEYRVVTTTSHHPLAPDFWLDHTFDRSGVTAEEIFELDLPASRETQIHINPDTPATPAEPDSLGDAARSLYRWRRSFQRTEETKPSRAEPDVLLTSFRSWQELGERLDFLRKSSKPISDSEHRKVLELTRTISGNNRKAERLYDFVAKEIKTVDLPLASVGFRSQLGAGDVLSSGYGTPLDKINLLDRLSHGSLHLAFLSAGAQLKDQLPVPSFLANVIAAIVIPDNNTADEHGHGIRCDHCAHVVWLDPALDVAPYGVVRPDFRGRTALFVASFPGEGRFREPSPWRVIPSELPFSSSQRVNVAAAITVQGALNAKVRYVLRGDNELLLRVAFHQAPKEKWKDVAQLLAISDGFRGKIANVAASDPYATKEPFTVEYEIVQPKFVDWAKKPVRIPALLPQLGLPDSAAQPGSGAGTSAIDLGTPLDVETHLTLHLPAGTSARTPAGTSVERDYATFASKYGANGATVTATRHLNFLLREVRGDRAADYNAFVRAVQGDEAQEFTLERDEAASQQTKPENSAKKD